MPLIDEFVVTLTDERRHQIITDYEQFEKEGVIGDCEMRRTAIELIDRVGGGQHRIVIWMRDLVFEVLRFYYDPSELRELEEAYEIAEEDRLAWKFECKAKQRLIEELQKAILGKDNLEASDLLDVEASVKHARELRARFAAVKEKK